MWYGFWKQHKKNSHIGRTRFGPQIFCRFLLPKFLTAFALKTCISPVLWSHCRTQCVRSATGWVKGTARARTHGYAGQDCISERHRAARLWANAAFVAQQQLQAMLRRGWTLPSLAPSKGGLAWGSICGICQPSPQRGKELSNPSPGQGLATTEPHPRLFIFSPPPPPSKAFHCKADFCQQKLFLAFFQPRSAVWGVSRVSATSFETAVP